MRGKIQPKEHNTITRKKLETWQLNPKTNWKRPNASTSINKENADLRTFGYCTTSQRLRRSSAQQEQQQQQSQSEQKKQNKTIMLYVVTRLSSL